MVFLMYSLFTYTIESYSSGNLSATQVVILPFLKSAKLYLEQPRKRNNFCGILGRTRLLSSIHSLSLSSFGALLNMNVLAKYSANSFLNFSMLYRVDLSLSNLHKEMIYPKM